MESLCDRPNLSDAQLHFSRQISFYRFGSAKLRKVRCGNVVFFHKKLKYLGPCSIWNGVVFGLVGVDKRTERIEQAVERVGFVRADFVNERI